jgi:hypothetical protein
MLKLGASLGLTVFVAFTVAAAGAQCGDQFVEVRTMCGNSACYVLACQGTTYEICQSGTGVDKMCGECDYLQAGTCMPPAPAGRTSRFLLVDPEEKAFASALVRSGCPLRGRALEEWIDENRDHRHVAQRTQKPGSLQ